MKKILPHLKKIIGRIDRRYTSRHWTAVIVIATLAILTLPAIITIVLDPFMRYHAPFDWAMPEFSREYYQIPGVLRHFDYDTVVVGSSMSQNFRIDEFESALGGRTVKATARGLLPATGRLFVEIAEESRHGEVRRVYWALDILTFNADKDAHYCPLPDYIYSGNHLYDVQYWWNWTLLSDYYPVWLKPRIIRNYKKRDRHLIRTDPARMFCWDYRAEPTGLEAMIAAAREEPLSFAPILPEKADESVQCNLLETVRKYPETEFTFFFSPYSVYFWCAMEETGCIESALAFREALAGKLLAEPNVRLYDFSRARDHICNEMEYKDMSHFTGVQNSWMTRCFADGSYRVEKPEDVRSNNQEILRLSAEYMEKFRAGFPPPARAKQRFSHLVER